MSKQIIGLLGFLALTACAAALGGWASASASSFYAELARPAWAPPAWLFGPVWTALYVLMAVAAWLVWREHGWRGAALPLGLFVLQLVFNALWSWLFFAWRLGFWAFVDVVGLWLALAATIATFWPRQRLAAVLLLPYWLWVSFATLLTWAVWQRNPMLLGF